MHGPNDPEIAELLVRESVLDTHAEVPVVIWINGEKHVVGHATIDGGVVSAVLNDPPLAEEVMDAIVGRPDECLFSIGFTKPPMRYAKPDSRIFY